MENKQSNLEDNIPLEDVYEYYLDDYDIWVATNNIIPFDENQYSNPEYYERKLNKNGIKEKVKLFLSDIQARHYILFIFIIVLFVVGVKTVLADNPLGYSWIISSILALIGLILNILYYIRYSEILLIIAGIFSFPIGLLMLFALEKNTEPHLLNKYETINSHIGTESRKAKNTNALLSKIWHFYKYIKIRYFSYLFISATIGFFLGWYYKLPNTKLLNILIQTNALWRKDLKLDYYRKKSPLISTEFFDFNWIIFFVTIIFCFLLILYFKDGKFRQYLRNKFEILKSN